MTFNVGHRFRFIDASVVQQMMDPVNPLAFHEPVSDLKLIRNDPEGSMRSAAGSFFLWIHSMILILMDNDRLKTKRVSLLTSLQREYHMD